MVWACAAGKLRYLNVMTVSYVITHGPTEAYLGTQLDVPRFCISPNHPPDNVIPVLCATMEGVVTVWHVPYLVGLTCHPDLVYIAGRLLVSISWQQCII